MIKFNVVAEVLIDEEDKRIVESASWYFNNGYVRGYLTDAGRLEYLHRLIAGAKRGDIVDHINRNPLDNRRANLRIVSRTENALNAPAQRVLIDANADYPRSPYKGAHWRPDNQKWSSSFRGKHLGLFDSDIEAASAYDNAVRESGADGAYLNFPDGDVRGPVIRIPRTKKSVKGSTSKYAGVSWNTARGKWQGAMKRGEVKLHLGFFDDEKECAGTYDAVARLIDGPSAMVNFPDLEFEIPIKLVGRLRQKGFDI